MTPAAMIAFLGLAAWAYLVFLHGGFWLARVRDDLDISGSPAKDAVWPRVCAVIPARNEADMLPASLGSLIAQRYAGEFEIVIVDDQSTDGTADVVRQLARDSKRTVQLVNGAPLPAAWTGKVWAMNQGIDYANSMKMPAQYLLLSDADISYKPDALTAIVSRARAHSYVLTSLMAKLHCSSRAERALVPAFIFFFQMLYPFSWVKRADNATAAAAGGCMLADRAALERAGGIAVIRAALIDDCALAAAMKQRGPIWLGLTNSVHSLRSYPFVADIRSMVARSAYAQLRYSPILLVGTVIAMTLVYLAPPALAMLASYPANLAAMAAYGLMVLSFQPTLHFYGRSPFWGLALPLIAAAYLAFTIDSAYQYFRGRGGLWKGRIQAAPGKR